eukprot:m.17609 g.17609  ORF g.17609 m.17609 type:complete len:207 (-) comp3598_c0_seq2:131-751(-)
MPPRLSEAKVKRSSRGGKVGVHDALRGGSPQKSLKTLPQLPPPPSHGSGQSSFRLHHERSPIPQFYSGTGRQLFQQPIPGSNTSPPPFPQTTFYTHTSQLASRTAWTRRHHPPALLHAPPTYTRPSDSRSSIQSNPSRHVQLQAQSANSSAPANKPALVHDGSACPTLTTTSRSALSASTQLAEQQQQQQRGLRLQLSCRAALPPL